MKTFSTFFFLLTKKRKYHKYISVVILSGFILSAFIYSKSLPVSGFKRKNQRPGLLNGTEKLVKEYVVTGKVTQTSTYCGGANPPQELLARLATPIAYPAKKFYIRRGKINTTKARIIKSFTTDSAGFFSISLAPGVHAVILEEQLCKIKPNQYNTKYQQADNKCLQQWWATPFYLLEVKDKNISELNFNFLHRCYVTSDIPCITYRGPLPL